MHVKGLYLFVSLLSGLAHIVTSSGEASVTVSPHQPHLVVPRNRPLVVTCMGPDASTRNTYIWMKDGVQLTFTKKRKRVYMQKNGSLMFEKVVDKPGRNGRPGRTDTGLYECYVTNDFGTFLGRQVHIQVTRQAFSVVPRDTAVVLGGVARFQCKLNVQSHRSNVYLWMYNNSVVSKLSVLQIHNVSQKDEGVYTCKVFTNGHVDMLEKSASLTIKSGSPPVEPQILKTPQNITVMSGDPAVLECLVEGSSNVHIEWQYADGRPVVAKDNDRVKVAGKSNLQISHSISLDSGSYECLISHSGRTIRRTYTLNILVPPEIIDHPAKSTIKPLFTRLFLNCASKGTPEPSVRWYKNGLRIYPATSLQMENELVLHGRADDSGYYQCLAENDAGYDIFTMWIRFNRSPNTPGDINDVVGYPVSSKAINLTWSAAETIEAAPVIAYVVGYHKLDGIACPGRCSSLFGREHDVTHQKVTTIVVENLDPYTDYAFDIHGVNINGGGLQSKVVVVRTKEAVPSSLPDVQITHDSTTSFRITWSKIPEEDRNGIITRYKLSYGTQHKKIFSILSGDTYGYLVTGVEPSVRYQICVQGGNSAGYTELGHNCVEYTTPNRTTKIDPTEPDLKFSPINSTAVRISWSRNRFSVPVRNVRIMVQNLIDSGPVREFNVSARVNSLVVPGLENRTFYKIDFMVRSVNNQVVSEVTELYQSRHPDHFMSPPPPVAIHPDPLSSTSLNLRWGKPKTELNITHYTVMYQQRREDGENIWDANRVKYIESKNHNAVLKALQAFTWYAIAIRANTAEHGGPFSKPVYIQTEEGRPSPPENLLAEVVSPGKVKLVWGPPREQNGIITYYIIYYNVDKDQPDTVWSSILQNASTTSMVVEDLTNKVYYFKLRACTNAGEGMSSHTIMIDTLSCTCPLCPSKECASTAQEDEPTGISMLGILIGCLIALTVILVTLFIIRQLRARYNRASSSDPLVSSNQSFGQYVHPSVRTETADVCEVRYSPISGTLQENAESDTKGGRLPSKEAMNDLQMPPKQRHSGGLNRFTPDKDMTSTENSALLTPSSSSSHGNDTSTNSTPDTGTLDSNMTSPDSLDIPDRRLDEQTHVICNPLLIDSDHINSSNGYDDLPESDTDTHRAEGVI